MAAIATLPGGRVSDGRLQEKLSRIDTVTLSSDGTALIAIDGEPDANLRLRYGMPLEQVLAAQPERGQPREPIRPGLWSDKEPDWVMGGNRLLQSCSVKQFDCNLD